jgi:NitT/TauT family transport system substrate-binding protein
MVCASSSEKEHLTRGAALALLGGALSTTLPRAAQAQSNPGTIRIAISLTEPYMVPYYARDAGFFQKAGLNIELIVQPTVSAALNAVAANAADCAQGDIVGTASGIIHGIDFGVFAGSGTQVVTKVPSLALAVLRDSPIRSARDLEGKSIGVVALNTLGQIATQVWLRGSGADTSKVAFIELPFTGMPAALARNNIAAAVTIEPFLSSPDVPLRILESVFNDLAPFYLGPWVSTRSWLSQNAVLARRFVATIYEAARWANAHPDETAAIIAKYTKFTIEDVKKGTRSQYATSLDPALISPVLAGAYRFGAISKPLTANDLIVHV